MTLGLMALLCRFSYAELFAVAILFILIDTSQPVFRVKSVAHEILWPFLSVIILLPFLREIPITICEKK